MRCCAKRANSILCLFIPCLSVALLGIGCAGAADPVAPATKARSAEAVGVRERTTLVPDLAPASTEIVVPPPPVAIVKLAYLPVLAHSPFLVAWDKGYWREEGLEVEGTEFGGSDQAMPFLAVGQLDVAGSSSGAGLLNMLAQGIGSRIVAGLSGVGPNGLTGQALMVRRGDFESGRLTSPADLRGRQVAVNGKGVYREFLADRHLRARCRRTPIPTAVSTWRI